MVGSRAGRHQQHGGSGDQKVAGSSDSERCIDAERNAGDNGKACSENACTAVDAPEPGHGPGVDRGNQSHAGRKSKAHQETCRRQHKDTKAGANDKVRSIDGRALRSTRCGCYKCAMGIEGLSGRAVFGGRGGSSAPLRRIATLTVSLAILPLAAGCSGSSLPSFGSSQSQAASVPPPPNASVAPAGQQAYAPPPSQPAAPATSAPAAQQDYSDLMPYPKQSLADVFRELGAAARSDRAASARHIYAIRSTLYATSAGRGRYRRCGGAAGKFRYFEPAGVSQAIAVRSHVEQVKRVPASQDIFVRCARSFFCPEDA